MSDTRRGFLTRALGATLAGPAAVRAALTAPAASDWVHVPHLASDELIEWMAATMAAQSRDAWPVFCEYANEAWNR